MILSRAGRKYREDALYWIAQQTERKEPLTGRLEVLIEVFPPDRRKRDLSNLPKAVEDAITKAGNIWVDDEQLDDLRLVRREPTKPGCVIVHIRPVPKDYNPTLKELGWK